MSLLFLKAATLLSNRARSLLKTEADVLIGNLFSDIRALSVYTPYFICSSFFILSLQKRGLGHSSLGILALATFKLLHQLSNSAAGLQTHNDTQYFLLFVLISLVVPLCPLCPTALLLRHFLPHQTKMIKHSNQLLSSLFWILASGN